MMTVYEALMITFTFAGLIIAVLTFKHKK